MVTVFTPTFNNQKRLPVLYKSLINQSDEDFEWVIVDDGSTDGTEKYIKAIKEDCTFKIIYKKVSHGGKHRAINEGVKLANGEYFFIVDSDDYLSSDAVSDIKKFFTQLDDSKKYAGISTVKLTTGEIYKSKERHFDFSYSHRYLYLTKGYHVEIYYTDVLRQHPFKTFEGENFLLEDTLWDQLALEGYVLRFYNTVTYMNEVHYIESEEALNVYSENPLGLFEWAKVELQSLKGLSYKVFILRRVWYSLNKKYTKKEICDNLCVSKFTFNFTRFTGKFIKKSTI